MNGIINVYKEKGYTSRDAVSRLMGILRQRKIGHTGTLDPMAEGVLPMCVGKATKICELLMIDKKQYLAVMQLGFETDTEDITGKVTEKTDFSEEQYKNILDNSNLSSVIGGFIGNILQTPPMYSAKKVKGKRLYELAREGKIIERTPSKIKVFNIEIKKIDFNLHEVTFSVDCSKGTYIRTLCKDIGKRLGCLATMKSLLRTRTGKFGLEESYKLDEIEKIAKENRLNEIIIPIERVFKEMPQLYVNDFGDNLLKNGGFLDSKSLVSAIIPKDNDRFRMYDKDGNFTAIYRFDEKISAFRVDKMF